MKGPKDRTLCVRARIDARYVEAGNGQAASGNYTLRYNGRVAASSAADRSASWGSAEAEAGQRRRDVPHSCS